MTDEDKPYIDFVTWAFDKLEEAGVAGTDWDPDQFGIRCALLEILADKTRSDNGEIDSIHRYERWLYLNKISILFLIQAEVFNCPIRIKILLQISDVLDEKALPVSFFKRLVSMQREFLRTGNRRERNISRNMRIRHLFKLFRHDDDNISNSDYKYERLDYENSLGILSAMFNLSVKSIERIVLKKADDVNEGVSGAEMFSSKDFERFWFEAMKIEDKENKIPLPLITS